MIVVIAVLTWTNSSEGAFGQGQMVRGRGLGTRGRISDAESLFDGLDDDLVLPAGRRLFRDKECSMISPTRQT
jgi:hypothetical protein